MHYFKMFSSARGTASALAMMVVLVASLSFAGADATFTPAVTFINDLLTGSLGRLLALGGVIIGVGAAIMGQFYTMLTGVVVALGAFYLPGAITTIITATL